MPRGKDETEQIVAFREIVRWARRTIPSPGSANPHHRADDWLHDTLNDLMTEPAPSGKHEERGFKVTGNLIQAICACSFATNRYADVSTAASAMSNHLLMSNHRFQNRSTR